MLDEATTGLDQESRRAVWDAIRAYAEAGGTVLLTTHYLEEAETLASRIVVVDQGRVVAEERSPRSAPPRASGASASGPSRSPTTSTGAWSGTARRSASTPSDPPAAVRRLVHAGARLERLEVTPLSLEDALRVRRDA